MRHTRLSAADLLDTTDLPDMHYSPLSKFRAPYRPAQEQAGTPCCQSLSRRGKLQIPPDANETLYEK